MNPRGCNPDWQRKQIECTEYNAAIHRRPSQYGNVRLGARFPGSMSHAASPAKSDDFPPFRSGTSISSQVCCNGVDSLFLSHATRLPCPGLSTSLTNKLPHPTVGADLPCDWKAGAAPSFGGFV